VSKSEGGEWDQASTERLFPYCRGVAGNCWVSSRQ